MSDPCECFFDHEAAMARLLTLLRGSQAACTDTDCMTDGFAGLGGVDTSMIWWSLLWSVFAMGMYLMRPNSLRNGTGNEALLEKAGPSSSRDNNDQPPPPPPPSAL